ncbi:MAG: ABC transporter substrate-binding protein [Alphaproteobacteria bacterium]|nr:ABC transporter substrate-binding protein [Alphaproteobacteria bacterium]
MRRKLVLALALAMAAGGGIGAASAKPLNWSFSGDVQTLDPHASNNTFTNAFINNVYEGLTRHTHELKIEPALAISWDLVNPTVWRFKLRQGVKFHNGESFDADDVVFSWARTNTPGALALSTINLVKDVRKVDQYTVDIETKGPFPILLSVLTQFFIMDQGWSAANNTTASTNLSANSETHANRAANGTGPFKLRSREADVKTVLEVNAGWWDKPAHNLTVATFTPIKSDATRTSSLLSGAIDATVAIPLQDIQRVSADTKLQVVQGPELRTIYFGFDQSRDELLFSDVKGKNPFKDIRVRRAIYQAIDVEAIKRAVMRGIAWPTGIIMSPYLTGYPQGLNDRLPFDPDGAKKLLTEAGYPNGFSVGLACPNDRYVYDEQICLAVTSMLAKIGIKIDPQFETASRWGQRLNTQNLSMFMLGHAGLPTADAYSTLSEVIATRGAGRGGLNAGGYSNPKFDAVLVKIEQEGNQAERVKLIREAMVIEKADIPHVPIHQQPLVWAAKKGIDMKQAPDNRLRLWYVKVD